MGNAEGHEQGVVAGRLASVGRRSGSDFRSGFARRAKALSGLVKSSDNGWRMVPDHEQIFQRHLEYSAAAVRLESAP